jgi:hypothetical protein
MMVLAIEFFDCSEGFAVNFHFNKTKAAAAACFPVAKYRC